MQLFKASNQWATRPDDERFWSLADMRKACEDYARDAVTATVDNADLRIEANGQDLTLIGKSGMPAKLTNYAFGQLAARAHSPAGYLRELPPTLAAQNINYRMKAYGSGVSKLLMHPENGGSSYLLRGISSEIYQRLWNFQILPWLERFGDDGWRVSPARGNVRPATAADVFPASQIQVGEMIGPSGLYASDHDMFVFMVNPEVQIEVGGGRTLCRGFFCWNAEIAGVSFGATSFLFDSVCGNHIVWGAQDVKEVRMRHVGRITSRGPVQIKAFIRAQAEGSAEHEEAMIRAARETEVGQTPQKVIEWMFSKLTITKKQAEESYKIASEEQDHDNPRSAWGVVQGLTRLSQQSKYAGERVALDRAAGKVMEVAF